MNNKYEFNIEGIIYPRFILSKSGDYYDFRKVLSNSIYGRNYQLNNRSKQSYTFDILIDINYFNLPILKEIPIIIENKFRPINEERNYYLLDYLIPSKSLVIELDSDYHDPIKDKMKDKYLSKLGLDVYRIYNLTSDDVIKLRDYINSTPDKEFRLDYSDLINNSKEYYNTLEVSKKIEYEGELYFIQNKWRRHAEILSEYDPKFKEKLINREEYKFEIKLDNIHRLIPMIEKKVKSYYPMINYFRKLGVDINIESERRGRFSKSSS